MSSSSSSTSSDSSSSSNDNSTDSQEKGRKNKSFGGKSLQLLKEREKKRKRGEGKVSWLTANALLVRFSHTQFLNLFGGWFSTCFIRGYQSTLAKRKGKFPTKNVLVYLSAAISFF